MHGVCVWTEPIQNGNSIQYKTIKRDRRHIMVHTTVRHIRFTCAADEREKFDFTSNVMTGKNAIVAEEGG